MKHNEKKILLILIIGLIILDQILKIIFFISNVKIGNIDGWSLGIIQNSKTESNTQYILMYIIAIGMLIRYITRKNVYINTKSRIIIGFAIAGCASNLIDRIWNGGIINYINIPKFSTLNLGYIYIIITWIGMAVILTKYTGERIKEKNEKRNNSK